MPIANCRAASPTRTPDDIDTERHRRRRDRREQRYRRAGSQTTAPPSRSWARRRDRLQALAAETEQAGGTSLVVEVDITDRSQAEAAVQQTVDRFGRLDTLLNNAGLMLLGPVVDAEVSNSGSA